MAKRTKKTEGTVAAVEIKGVGDLCIALLKRGKTYAETLEAAKRVFPQGNTSMKSIYFYAVKAGVTGRGKAQADPKELKRVLAQLAA